jgi:hypothetical protein
MALHERRKGGLGLAVGKFSKQRVVVSQHLPITWPQNGKANKNFLECGRDSEIAVVNFFRRKGENSTAFVLAVCRITMKTGQIFIADLGIRVAIRLAAVNSVCLQAYV